MNPTRRELDAALRKAKADMRRVRRELGVPAPAQEKPERPLPSPPAPPRLTPLPVPR